MFLMLIMYMKIFAVILESNGIRSDDTYAKDRIRSARLKLNGINPAVITAYVYEINPIY
jgi:hypothetical protein